MHILTGILTHGLFRPRDHGVRPRPRGHWDILEPAFKVTVRYGVITSRTIFWGRKAQQFRQV
jgi:hypothetical protein